MAKRALDILVSLLVLMFLGWFILIFFIISSLVHRSNGLFTQERIGKNAKPFKIMKLKTMKKIPGYSSTTTTKEDPRVTAFGNFLRKSKIDELPQVFNVLLGEMSLVGPRPTVREDYEKMNDQQRRRFEVAPGITGIAQINGNTALPWPKRIEYDIEYVDTVSLGVDLVIIWKTFLMLLSSNAETHPTSSNEWE